MSADRTPCLVPFCRRTAPAEKYPPGTRIICGKCWRKADVKRRRLYTLAVRRQNARPTNRGLRRCWRLFEWIAAQAIARANEPAPIPKRTRRRASLTKPKHASLAAAMRKAIDVVFGARP